MTVRFIAAVALLLWLTPMWTFAQGRPTALQGVNAVTVKASIVAPPETLPTGLTEARLQTLVELKLRAWSLSVLSAAEDAHTPGVRPRVDLEVTMVETRAVQKLAGYAFFMRLVVTELGTSIRNGAPVLNELWSHSFLNVSDLKTVVSDMERSTAELLDQFINEWVRTRRARPSPRPINEVPTARSSSGDRRASDSSEPDPARFIRWKLVTGRSPLRPRVRHLQSEWSSPSNGSGCAG